MLTPQFMLDLFEELLIDNFAGGGGGSMGIELATGRHVDHAINHAWDALGMHCINHPQTVHHCEDVFDIDPLSVTEGRPVALGWFSPDCKHFSKAKGGKPLSKKIRGLAFVMLRWAKIRVRVMPMENVEEIKTWGPLLPDGRPDKRHIGRTWQALRDALGNGVAPDHPDIPEMLEVLCGNENMVDDPFVRDQIISAKEELLPELIRGYGYKTDFRDLRGCDYGAPTIRKRLFMIARCDGKPIVWPKPTHAPIDKAKELGLKAWRSIAECIDWMLPIFSIFLTRAEVKKLCLRCRRPLKKATLRRIAKGIDRYVLKAKRPFLVSLTHQGGDRVESVDDPAKVITGAHRGEKGLVDASVAPFLTEHANATHQRNMPVDEPLRTQCAEVKGGHFGLVAGTVIGAGGPAYAGKPKPLDKPFHTLTTENHSNLITANLCREFGESIGQPVTEPAPTVMPHAQGKTSLITATVARFNGDHAGREDGASRNQSLDGPISTQDTSNRFGLVTGTIVGCGGRAAQSQPRPLDAPAGTGTAKADSCIAAASVVKLRGTNIGHAADEPGHVASAGGQHHVLSAAYLAQHNAGGNTNPGHPADDPASTISGKGSQQQLTVGSLIKYYGTDQDPRMDEPMHSATTKPRFGLNITEAVAPILTDEQIAGARRVAAFLREFGVEFEGELATITVDGVSFVLVDIGMRMLTPRELFRAQGFPDSYVIDKAWVVDPQTGNIKEICLTKEQQIRMCGNSVCPPVVEALIRANLPELCRPRPKRKRKELALAA